MMRGAIRWVLACLLGVCLGGGYVVLTLEPEAETSRAISASRPPPSAEFTELVKEANDLMDTWAGRGHRLTAAGEKLAEAAALLKDDDPYLRLAMARLHLRAGQRGGGRFLPGTLEKAFGEIDRALALDPGLALAHSRRANLEMLAGQLSKAQASLDRAAALGLDNAELINNRAELHWLRNEKDEAADLYRLVPIRFPEEKRAGSVACLQLIKYHAERLERADAQYYYVRKSMLDPDNAWTHGDWATVVLFKFYDYEDAILAARRAIGIMDYGMARWTLAMALYAKWGSLLLTKRLKDEAQVHFDEARRLMPDLDEVVRQSEGRPVMDLAVLALTQPDHPFVTGRLSTAPRR